MFLRPDYFSRGPNKYTRNWEDENAYRAMIKTKPAPRRKKNQEEFPALDGRRRDSDGDQNQNDSNEQYKNARNQNR